MLQSSRSGRAVIVCFAFHLDCVDGDAPLGCPIGVSHREACAQGCSTERAGGPAPAIGAT